MQKPVKRPHRLAFLRKWWQLLILVLAFTSTQAQSDSSRYTRLFGHGYGYKRTVSDSVALVPLYESPHIPYRAGAIKYRKSDSSFYKYTGTQWLKVQEGGVATNGIDTVYTMNDTVQVIETPDETYFTIINSPYTEVIDDTTIVIGGDTLIINGKGPSLVGITELTGDGAAGPGSGLVTFTLANTPVTPGSYINPNITVDSKGRVTGISSGSGGGSGIGEVVAGYGLVNVNDSTLDVDTVSIATRGRLYKVADSLIALMATAGTANANAGAGYRILIPSTQETKTIFPRWGELIDSTTNADGLTIGPDSTLFSTRAWRQKGDDSVAGVLRQVIIDTAAAIRADFPSGGSGISGLTAGRVTLSTSATTIGDDSRLLFNTTQNKLETDSIRAIKVVPDTIHSNITKDNLTKRAWFFGTSITDGSFAVNPVTGAADTTRAWPGLVSAALKMTETNKGVGLMTLEKQTPIQANNMIDYLPNVPAYSVATDSIIVFAFGENDAIQRGAGNTNYNSTNYIADYTTILNEVTGTLGWPLNRIYIVSNSYIDSTLSTNVTKTIQDIFFAANQTVASNFSVAFIDVYNTSYNGRRFWYNDATGIHPGNEGMAAYAEKVIQAIGASVTEDNQRMAVNGPVEFEQLKITRADTATHQDPTGVLGWASNNQVVKFPYGSFIQNGPLQPQNGNINLRGNINATGGSASLNGGTITGNFVRAIGNRVVTGVGAGPELFDDGTTARLYSFNQAALSWRPFAIYSSTYEWRAQGNANILWQLDASGRVFSTVNTNAMHYNAISNNNTGTAASSVLQVGINTTLGNGLQMRYNGSGFTTAGAYEAATSIIDAGPNITTGLNFVASNSTAGFKWFTGGTASGNERMRMKSDGELLIGSTTDNGTFRVQNTGGLYQNGAVGLHGITGRSDATTLFAHHTDSSLVQIPFSTLATQSALNDTAAAIRSAIGGGGGISGSGTSGRVAFWDGASSITSDANYLYSASNAGTLSLGTSATRGHLNVGGNRNYDGTGSSTAWGLGFYSAATTYTDNVTAGSGSTNFAQHYLEGATIAASNSSVTVTSPMTLRVDGPAAGTNVTITGVPYAIAAFSPVWINGAVKTVVGAASDGGTVSYSSNILTCDATSGNFNVNLPSAATYSGFSFTFKRIDNAGNTCTVSRSGSDTIDGATSYSLTAQYKYVKVVSDGTNWLVIANN